MSPLKAVFLDVGGTLWTNDLVIGAEARTKVWLRQLAAAIPGATAEQAQSVLTELVAFEVGARLQSTEGIATDICEMLTRRQFLADPATVTAVRRAMVVSASLGIRRHPGFDELFGVPGALPLRRSIVSNTTWRDAECYWRDLGDFGVARHVHAVITSVDVGQKKPHRAMFDAALAAAGCEPQQAVMVGNSEAADIAPAWTLGMRTIRVCIEEPLASDSAADAVVTSLADVAKLIQKWSHQ